LQPDVVLYNAVLGACEKAGQWQRALSFLAAPPLLLRPDVVSWSSVASGVAASGVADFGWSWSLWLLLKLRSDSQGVRPDAVMCNVALSALARGGSWEKAVGLLASLPQWRLQPTTVSFNSCSTACEKARQWRWPLWLLTSMHALSSGNNNNNDNNNNNNDNNNKDAQRFSGSSNNNNDNDNNNAVPDVITYSSAISACEKCGRQWRQAVMLLRRMRSRLVQPNTVTFNALISACEQQPGEDVEDADDQSQTELCQTTNKLTNNNDNHHHHRVDNHNNNHNNDHLPSSNWPLSLSLLEEMRQRALVLTLVSCNAALSCLEKGWAANNDNNNNNDNNDNNHHGHGVWTLAIDLLAGCVKEQRRPDRLTYGAVLGCLSRASQWAGALGILQQMCAEAGMGQQHLAPDEAVYAQ
ncbi:unnamed protein product, partial [Polarella glacialis]